jgi:hypothetical protein
MPQGRLEEPQRRKIDACVTRKLDAGVIFADMA